MINQMGAYILSVVAAAMAISIIGSVCDQKTGTGKLIRMICGMVLGIRILSGIMQADFRGLTTLTDELFQSADSAITYGNQIASSATSEIIKGETEAYILDKANDLCASINVEVLVSEGEIPIPESVRIVGNISPYARSQLEQMMESELGIAKEKQQWIG